MLKRVLLALIAGLAFFALVVFLDEVFEPYSPFKGELSRSVDHLINGSPQSAAVDMADALRLFDDTCMVGSVFKVPPFSVDDLFAGVGLNKDGSGNFHHPDRPLNAYAFDRNEGKGFECFVHFISFEDVDAVMRPTFDEFTQTRLRSPMRDNPDAFQFGTEDQDDPEIHRDPPTIRSFASRDDIMYFVIFRPSSYTVKHILQLIVLPISEFDQPG